MQKTEAIIFDLGGVILNIDYNLARNAFEKIGIKKFHDMYSQADADDLFSNLEIGKISEDNCFSQTHKTIKLTLNYEFLSSMMHF